MKKLGESSKNMTWHINQAIIQNAYIKLIKEFKRCPTLYEISLEVNLSIRTLEKHVQELKFEPLKDLMRTLTPDVVMAIANSARKGSSASQKLWMQVMEGWAETQQVKQIQEQPLFPYIKPNGISSNNGNTQITETKKP